MDTASPVDVAQQLVSDLEGLAVSATAPSSPQLLPSLQQFYRLGLVLFRILDDNNGDGHPVAIAYRKLIESLSDEMLEPVFRDLRRASGRLLASGTVRVETDLARAARSVAGLVGAFSDGGAPDPTCGDGKYRSGRSRLCRLAYDHEWTSTLAAFYDRFVVAEKRQQRDALPDPDSSASEMETNKTAVLSCLSRMLLDGLILPVPFHRKRKNAPNTPPVEESLLEAIRSMEEESIDCLRDLQEWQLLGGDPFRRTLEESLSHIGGNRHRRGDDDDDDDDDAILERAQQREYIASMLESARGQPSSMAVVREAPTSKPKTNTGAPSKRQAPPAETELDRRVKQVLQVLPHFGEGFVEVALGLYKGDVEATVATLLQHPADGDSADPGYPTALRMLDPKLPRRKREFVAYQTAEEEAASAREARADVKERLALEEKQKREEYEALVVVSASASADPPPPKPVDGGGGSPTDQPKPGAARKLTRKELRQQKLREQHRRVLADEYNDDYDDQYDEVDIKLGAADDGFTTDHTSAAGSANNMTYEQIKLYNKIVQEDMSDASFWESNRNTNKKGSNNAGNNNNNNNSNNNTDGEASKKQWGPDKIKGGRIIGADGKIVRKPGGVRKKKNGNNRQNNNNNNNNNTKKGQGGNSNSNNNSNGGNGGAGSSGAGNNNNNKKKPRTKPKSDNRVNRQRDRKMNKQGAFGVQ